MGPLNREIREKHARSMLDDQPEASFAIFTDAESDAKAIILTVVIRNVGATELRVPKFTALTAIELQNTRFTLQ